ncbi:hypothetical protein BM524_02560 [Alteromonas mediterranea]|uniref:SH3b domain-containing protein n=2 Tax=Alteromonas mediterranea TaxID=314275 RepID=A0AAC9J966_9ALTE|nr:hypothetical protein BM524_02560 [Alteromonas mediterranea]
MVALSTADDADTLPLSLSFRNATTPFLGAKFRQKWNKLAFIAVNQYHLHVLNSKIGLHMIRKWLAAALIACSFQAFSLQDIADLEASSSHYIRDDLFIFVHTGPGRNYRILGSIEAGTPITVLARDNDAEFTQITDPEGRKGWVESKFVSNTMSQAEQLPIISEKLAESQSSLQTLQSDNANLRQQLNDARQQVSKLTTTNDEQASQIIRLTAKVESANKDELVMWFTRGGLVAGIGILLGVMLTYLPKRKRRSSEWM